MRAAIGALVELLLTGGALAAGCGSCKTTGGSPPVTADQVTAELVDAGCLAQGGSAAVLAELQADATQDPALQREIACLFEGGTVAGCGGCEVAGFVRRPAP